MSTPIDDGDEFPLSFAQQRLWFLDQLEGAGAAYVVRLAVRLGGTLRVPLLERALAAVVARHEALRTTLLTRQGEGLQRVAAHVDVPLQVESWPGAAEAALRRRVAALSSMPFDLARGPLFRAHLLRAAPDDHVLLLLTHHVISDAWSSGVIFRDLAACYAALAAGRVPELPELPVQYADYTVWQREWLQGNELQRQLAWWRDALAGAPPLLTLPTDRPRLPVQGYRGGRWVRVLPAPLTAQVRELGRGAGATLFMTLLAAYAVLLGRHAGQEDVVIGTPVAGRRRSELENVVGFFANTLPLRIDLAGGPSFGELLTRVRNLALAAWDHQDLPFEKLVEALQPARSLSHAPLFQAMLILQNTPWEAGALPGLTVRPAETDPGDTAKFDLTLSATEFEGELWLGFEYDSDLFDAATIGRLSARFVALLESAVADPHAPVGHLALVPAAEAADARLEGPRAALPAERVEDLVGAAGTNPYGVAIESAHGNWTWRQLADWSDDLAARLRGFGLPPGTPVAVSLGRRAELVGAWLAVAKAGRPWLPLDPEFPAERVAFMLEDSAAAVLVTSRDLWGAVPEFAGRVVCIDDLGAPDCARTPAAEAAPDAAAYVIYTSGSTGQPKGVVVQHRGVVNFLQSILLAPGLGPDDRLLAVTTPSFDIAVLELLAPLCAGATLVLASRDEARDPVLLARRLRDSQATVLQATPATWHGLVTSGWTGEPRLRMFCGGEALRPDLARALLPLGAQLWNLYGPTETTVWSSATRITDPDDIVLGRPLLNTALSVRESSGAEAAVGVAGELWIGGAGVAAGYWRREGLTAERFITEPNKPSKPNPAPKSRWYRTGDRVRRRWDGELEYLGRLDEQLKVRGYRIEPGEIEAAVARDAGVERCVVVLREGAAAGEGQLWCYAVARRGATLEWERLRAQLRERLPAYAVPAGLVVLDALPLTPNGKVDRRALPAPDAAAGTVQDGYVAPRSGAEEILCSLFAEVLGRAVGVHEDFFAAGGHSLLATRLMARLRTVLNVEVPLKALFEGPTVAELAARLPTLGEVRGPALVKCADAGDDSDHRSPLSYTQQRLWFLEQLQPGQAAYHLQVAWRLEGELDVAALGSALATVVARHEALRTCFRSEGGEPWQEVLAHLEVPIHTEAAPAEEARLRERLGELAGAPFDLHAGPLLRVHLLTLAPRRQVLLLVLHHLVADGWSLAVLMRELSGAYDAALNHRAAELPELPVRYRDYARWQRQWLQGEELHRQLGYWRDTLNDTPVVMSLPLDRPRLPVQRHRGAWLGRQLDPESTAALQRLAREEGCTLFMVLLAGFALVLSRFGGDEDLVIGTPVAGRERTELEGLIGFFINTLVLRVNLAGNPTVKQLLARIRERALGAYAHAALPFERLVDELNPPRDPSRTPVFQVMLNLHNEPARSLAFAGLHAEPLAAQRRTAKFDLSVSLQEHAHGLGIGLEYNTDLFDAGTMDSLADAFVTVLHTLPVQPWRATGELLLVPPAGEVRRPAHPVDPATTLLGAFEAAARTQAERLAVDDGARRLSYGALRAAAAGVATALRERGVKEGDRVALLLGHDAQMVVGLLGALGSGAAYVPLDPYAPAARSEAILRAAQVTALVVDEARRAAAPWLEALGLPVVVVEQTLPAGAFPSLGRPEDLAYVLYTSGSTGRPKGVMQSQENALAQVRCWSRQLGLTPDDRCSLLSGYGYDAAVQDLFGALLSGASLHPLDLRGGLSAPEVVDRIAGHGITVLHATPTVYRYLFGGRVTCRQDLTAVRWVVLGGEAARRADLELFKVRFRRPARFINGLGLTESTMALQYLADHETKVLGQDLPVGLPVGELEVELQDDKGNPHPWHGELVLKGPHLALGYLDDPAQTHQRFGLDPGKPGWRTYRTGDQLRRLPDGQYVHAGRRDDQLKLRGIRIEPGEVAALLREQAGVTDCHVAADTDATGEARLVAWVVATPDLAPDALRRALRRRLPEYLVPAAFLAVAHLPRRPNGKVDTHALLVPEEAAPEQAAGGAAVPPRDEIEARLVDLWRGVLKREAIGVYDDFFALGGHSLLATRLIARVRDAFRLELPLLALFESPTVAGMADALQRLAAAAGTHAAPALRRQERVTSAGTG